MRLWRRHWWRWYRRCRTLPPRFKDKHDNQPKDDQQQQKDALAPARVFLVARRVLEDLDGVLHLHRGLLDVVLDRVEHRALVDDQHREVFEQLCERRYGFGDLCQLPIAGLEVLRGRVCMDE